MLDSPWRTTCSTSAAKRCRDHLLGHAGEVDVAAQAGGLAGFVEDLHHPLLELRGRHLTRPILLFAVLVIFDAAAPRRAPDPRTPARALIASSSSRVELTPVAVGQVEDTVRAAGSTAGRPPAGCRGWVSHAHPVADRMINQMPQPEGSRALGHHGEHHLRMGESPTLVGHHAVGVHVREVDDPPVGVGEADRGVARLGQRAGGLDGVGQHGVPRQIGDDRGADAQDVGHPMIRAGRPLLRRCPTATRRYEPRSSAVAPR